MTNPSRALELGERMRTAAGVKKSKSPSSFFSELNRFYHTGKRLYLGKIV